MPDNKPPGVTLSIDIANQFLTLATQSGDIIARYPVSTGLNGPGQADGSGTNSLKLCQHTCEQKYLY